MVQEISELDKKLLNILQENADLTYSEIGKILGVSPSTVYMRLRKLKERGLIKRIVAEVAPELVGLNLRALVFLSIDVRKYSDIASKLANIPNVKAIYDVTGEWTLVAEVYVKDHKELSDLLDVIGTLEGVQRTSTAVVLRVIKEDRKVLIT
ncbi:MAG: Lrp/AsnC family transcriptional regulator [Desulfurococcaceae archaeon]|nr:Lrp/AsnC family transcriptional regulator [Desulfurococcaceae archaeon]